MCRILEFSKHPELFSGDNTVDIVRYIVVYLVVCHCTYYNIMLMRLSAAAGNNEIQPCIRHFLEFKNIEFFVDEQRIDINNRRCISLRPAFSLFFYDCAIEACSEILGITANNDSRLLHFHIASVIDKHFPHSLLLILFDASI